MRSEWHPAWAAIAGRLLHPAQPCGSRGTRTRAAKTQLHPAVVACEARQWRGGSTLEPWVVAAAKMPRQVPCPAHRPAPCPGPRWGSPTQQHLCRHFLQPGLSPSMCLPQLDRAASRKYLHNAHLAADVNSQYPGAAVYLPSSGPLTAREYKERLTTSEGTQTLSLPRAGEPRWQLARLGGVFSGRCLQQPASACAGKPRWWGSADACPSPSTCRLLSAVRLRVPAWLLPRLTGQAQPGCLLRSHQPGGRWGPGKLCGGRRHGLGALQHALIWSAGVSAKRCYTMLGCRPCSACLMGTESSAHSVRSLHETRCSAGQGSGRHPHDPTALPQCAPLMCTLHHSIAQLPPMLLLSACRCLRTC